MHKSVIMYTMDFVLLPKSAIELVASLTLVVNTSFSTALPPPQETGLVYPSLISSYNLPSEIIVSNKDTGTIQNLSDAVRPDDLSLKTVMKKEEPLEVVDLVTVDLPVIYTVREPAPSPTEKPKLAAAEEEEEEDKIKIEIIKEAKAEEIASPSPSPTVTSSPSATPTPAPAAPGNSNSEQMFQMVNDHRAKIGLAAFEKDERLCKMAQERAPQIKGELSNGTLHKGFKDYNLPYWATENIAAYSNIQDNLKFWLSDYIHKKAIESNNKYSCVACDGASCSQIFTSFVPK